MMKRNLLVIGLATLLGACGFQLRGVGSGEFALKELALDARNSYGETTRLTEAQLQGYGVRLHAGAPYKLVLVREEEKQRTASYTGSVRSAEYELNRTLDYQIRGSKNLLLLEDQASVQKIYLHDGSNLIGSDQEASQLRDEMRAELVQQLVMRLQRLTPAQLDQLQADAEARLRAEQEALEAARKAEAEATAPQQSPLQLPLQLR